MTMRNLTIGFLAATALAGLSTARAADLDDDYLRGPEYDPTPTQIIDWSGFYVGGHGGYSSAALGFKNVYQEIISNQLQDTTAESNFGASTLLRTQPVRTDRTTFGALVGYNFQFDDFVVGIEGDYTRFGKTGYSSDSVSRTHNTADGIVETLNLTGSSSTRLEDYGTIRGRVGYALGNFLPFVTGGFAIGRALVTDRVTYQSYGFDKAAFNANQTATTGLPAYVYRFGYSSFDPTDPTGVGSVPSTGRIGSAKTKVVGGVTLGGGVEYAITSNFLLRGEYQYVLFNDVDGHRINLNTVRAGAAYKF
jgi:opacity protein-like surface antigen